MMTPDTISKQRNTLSAGPSTKFVPNEIKACIVNSLMDRVKTLRYASLPEHLALLDLLSVSQAWRQSTLAVIRTGYSFRVKDSDSFVITTFSRDYRKDFRMSRQWKRDPRRQEQVRRIEETYNCTMRHVRKLKSCSKCNLDWKIGHF